MTNERCIWVALGLKSVFTLIEVIASGLTGSLALFSDAAHMLSDMAALIIALLAIQISKKIADKKRTFGYYRFEILAAVINAVILFLVALYIFHEAYQRLKYPPTVYPITLIAIAILGLLINLLSIRLLKSGSEHSLNVRGAYLEAWADMLGSLGIIVSAVVIYFTGWQIVDSVMAMAIGMWLLPRTWTLLKESINILLEGVPDGIDLMKVHDTFLTIPGVISIHDLHIWALSSGKISLTAHLVINQTIANAQAVLRTAMHLVETQFPLVHATLQIEVEACCCPTRTFDQISSNVPTTADKIR